MRPQLALAKLALTGSVYALSGWGLWVKKTPKLIAVVTYLANDSTLKKCPIKSPFMIASHTEPYNS